MWRTWSVNSHGDNYGQKILSPRASPTLHYVEETICIMKRSDKLSEDCNITTADPVQAKREGSPVFPSVESMPLHARVWGKRRRVIYVDSHFLNF